MDADINGSCRAERKCYKLFRMYQENILAWSRMSITTSNDGDRNDKIVNNPRGKQFRILEQRSHSYFPIRHYTSKLTISKFHARAASISQGNTTQITRPVCTCIEFGLITSQMPEEAYKTNTHILNTIHILL